MNLSIINLKLQSEILLGVITAEVISCLCSTQQTINCVHLYIEVTTVV